MADTDTTPPGLTRNLSRSVSSRRKLLRSNTSRYWQPEDDVLGDKDQAKVLDQSPVKAPALAVQPSAKIPAVPIVPETDETAATAPPEEYYPGEDSGFVHLYTSRYDIHEVPKYRMQPNPVPAQVAFQAITDLRQLDANPRMNLASFCTTWMEPEARELLMDGMNVNLVDVDQYPASNDIHMRCVRMIADLYNAPHPEDPVGTGTTGSSEAIMLGALALKKRWVNRRKEAGLPHDNPNLVMGHNTQVVWEKFCRYFDVEIRMANLEDDLYVMTPETARPLIDENTIGIVSILGSTYTGEYEDIEAMNNLCDELRAEKGWELAVHVDAASGGFVAPFLDPELLWDFRLPNVRSINVSGHKYGLVYPGVGWVIWKDKIDLPEELVFHTNYLGSDQPNITLTFSRPAAPIIAQYYQLLRLGRGGYTAIMSNLQILAQRMTEQLLETGDFKILSKEVGVPVVAFTIIKTRKVRDASLKPGEEGWMAQERLWDEFDLVDKLKERGWTLPAYRMAPNARHIKMVRAVIREDMSMTLIAELVSQIKFAVKFLDAHEAMMTQKGIAEAKESLRAQFAPHLLENNPLRSTKHNIQC